MSQSNKREGSCSLGGCNECFARLGAELGFPDPDYDFYEGLKQLSEFQLVTENSDSIILSGNGTSESPLIAELSPDVVTSIITNDTATVVLNGDGSDDDPLEASLAQGAIVSTDGSVNVSQSPDGVVDLSVDSVAISTNDTPTVLLAGDGTPGIPLEASFAPTALTSTGGTLSVVQQPDGTFNLEAVGAGAAVVHNDTASIVLNGDGTPGVPLEAELAPTAITSADSSVTVTPGVGGTFDLSVSDVPITTSDSASVALTGDGTVGNPLEAELTPTAIASADSSVTVTPGVGGTFDLSVSDIPITTSDSNSVILSGDGTVGTPLEAELAPTAIASADSSVTVTPGVGGTFDLSVSDIPITTSNSASVVLNGDGTSGTPLEAELTPTAIASANGSVTVTPGVGGTFDLSTSVNTTSNSSIVLSGDGTVGTPLEAEIAPTALASAGGTIDITANPGGTFNLDVVPVAAPISIESPDSSIAIVEPAVVGDPYELTVASTFTGSASVQVNETPGTAVTPPDYSFLLAATALTSLDSSVSLTYGVGGVFDLSVAAASGVIPRTVVVGGTIGATPSAATLAAAIALILTPIAAPVRWTLLVCPGTYAGNVTIPANVNLIALSRGSVLITDTVSFIPLVSDLSSYSNIVGIACNADIIINSTATTGTCQYTFSDCVRIAVIATTKLAGVSAIGDLVILEDSVLRFITLTGTMIVRGISIRGQLLINTGSVFEATNSTLTSTPTTISGFASILGCAIGGAWSTNGTARCLIRSCKVAAYNTGPVLPDGIPFTIINNSGTAYVSIRDTDIVHRVTRNDNIVITWTITSPNLPASANGIDREIDFTLLSIPASAAQITLAATLQVPLITTPWSTQLLAGQQVPVTAIQVSGTGNSVGLSSSVLPTTSVITLSNASTLINPNAVSVSIRPPADNLIGWYSPVIGL